MQRIGNAGQIAVIAILTAVVISSTATAAPPTYSNFNGPSLLANDPPALPGVLGGATTAVNPAADFAPSLQPNAAMGPSSIVRPNFSIAPQGADGDCCANGSCRHGSANMPALGRANMPQLGNANMGQFPAAHQQWPQGAMQFRSNHFGPTSPGQTPGCSGGYCPFGNGHRFHPHH